jgi:putative ABC transport system substrate-binding protein
LNRRDLLILGAGTAIALPLSARAQQKAMPVVGYLASTSPGPLAEPIVAELRQGLSEAGYIEGQNVAIEYRWADGHYDRLPALAAGLVGDKVDVIAALATPSALAAKNATSKIPIVFAVADAVASGLVASLARPGSNLTGVSVLIVELMPKRLELLSEFVPHAQVIALLANPNNPNTEPMIPIGDRANQFQHKSRRYPGACGLFARAGTATSTPRRWSGMPGPQTSMCQPSWSARSLR